MIDDATRARLERTAADLSRVWPVVSADLHALLAAYDAQAPIVQAAEAFSVARQQLIALLARNAPGAEIQRASFALEAAWGPLDVAVGAAGEGRDG